MTTSLRTPLKGVRGYGSARAGTGHFIGQRVSAIALAILAPYLIVYAAFDLAPDFGGARAWIAQPWVAAPLLLALFAALYHMRIGMQAVVEDYIAKPASKTVLLLLNTFVALALAAAGGFAILKLSLGA
jgi:succinate dehydrogenase / fumarate reductase membrane anchor subunit